MAKLKPSSWQTGILYYSLMAMLLLTIISSFVDISNHTFNNLTLAVICLLSAVCVWAPVLIPTEKYIISFNIFSTAIITAMLLCGLMLSGKGEVLSYVILMPVCIAAVVIATAGGFKVGLAGFVLILIPIYTFLQLFKYTAAITYSGSFPFVELILIVGGIAGVIVAIKVFMKKKKFFSSLGWFFVVTLIASAALVNMVSSLNYALDTSEPMGYDVVIEKKHIDNKRKGPDDYEFTFTLDGEETTVNVPSDDYYRYEVGDFYSIVRYEGAFEPFYMSLKYNK